MTQGSADWADGVQAALEGRSREGVRLVPSTAPPLVDALTGLVSPLLAALVWAGAIFREGVAGQPLDPVALLLRALALGLTVRALLDLAGVGARLRLAATASRHRLALSEGGLGYRAPGAPDRLIAREDLLGVRAEGDWQGRGRSRAEPVHVLYREPAGVRTFALPPVFAGGPGVVAEALMRLRPRPRDDAPAPPGGGLPSRTYDEAAAGHPGPGVVAIRHGAAWLAQGPQATMLLGVALLDGFARLPTAGQVAVGPVALAVGLFAAVVAPVGWAWLGWRHVRVRKGLSLVASPDGLTLRTRAGVLPIPWSELARTRIEARRRWSLLGGARSRRTLVLDRRGDDPVRYDEAFLGAPAEVVAMLVEAYQRGDVGPEVPGTVLRPE